MILEKGKLRLGKGDKDTGTIQQRSRYTCDAIRTFCGNIFSYTICISYLLQVEPHEAVAEVSKIGNV